MDSNLRSLFKKALAEDIGGGDITTQALIPKNQQSEAVILAKDAGVFSGGPVAAEVFHLQDRGLRVKLGAKEGARVKKGQKVMTVRGRTRSILEAERTALNFLGHLSGIATLTRHYVDKVRGTKVKIYDTRKTTPLWRSLEKYAVKCGGGKNHRFGLFEEILVKDNHWAALRSLKLPRMLRVLATTKKRMKIPIEVEVRNIRNLARLLESPFVPDRILLDNFSVSELKRAVIFVKGLDQVLRTRYQIRRRADRTVPDDPAADRRSTDRRPMPELEASGGVNLANVRAVAKTGVQRISIGRLTHSAPALDFSLRIL